MKKGCTLENSLILQEYHLSLQEDECSENTIQKYLRDAKKFLCFIQHEAAQLKTFPSATNKADNEAITKNPALPLALKNLQKPQVLAFKAWLITQYAPASVNSMLAAVNHFLSWCGLFSCRVKPLKIQKNTFCDAEKELSEREYYRLLASAEENGEHKLSLLIQTICATGIRVSELPYITVQSVRKGQAKVHCKNKTRIIFLPKELCKMLKHFCLQEHITNGAIFCTKSGKPIDRSNIWKMMKRLCARANVNAEKVFPHNLRHLFARTYYKLEKDIARLADLLGHTNINTTRIYMIETGKQHAKQVNRMNLLYRNDIGSNYCQTKKRITT